ncbi:MAG: type IV toxin-antitoxin system AbiEi family antitoxin domain-containing protein [Microcella sp.]
MDALMPFASSSTLCLTRRDLLDAGVTPRAIASAVRSERLVRARRGVYVPSTAPRHVIKAVRVGGLAAGTTAAESFGLWVPEERVTEVWLPHNAARLRSPTTRRVPLTRADRTGVHTHWKPLLDPQLVSSWRVGARDAVAQCLRRLPRELAVAVLDSALNSAVLGLHELPAIEQQLPIRRRWWLTLADGRAGSGTETLVRLALQDAGLRVTPQVAIEGVGFVDLLVGSRVVVEVDSEQWHSTPAQRDEDARRDLALRLRGYVVVRVRYAQAMHDRAAVVESVLASVDATHTRGVSLSNRRS